MIESSEFTEFDFLGPGSCRTMNNMLGDNTTRKGGTAAGDESVKRPILLITSFD